MCASNSCYLARKSLLDLRCVSGPIMGSSVLELFSLIFSNLFKFPYLFKFAYSVIMTIKSNEISLQEIA